jgi:uncharacterized membrane protein YfcA
MGLAVPAVGAGLIVGFLIGLTGMGGGSIMTPFLILFMKFNPLLAVGTDMAFAAITKWTAGIQHSHQKNVNVRMVAWLALGSLPASLVASSLVLSYDKSGAVVNLILPKILGVVLFMVALYTLARAFNWIRIKENVNWPPAWALTVIGVVGGAMVGLTSVGSGTIIMAALLIFFSLSPAKLVGMDIIHGALLTTVPALVYAFGGHVDWRMVAWLLVGSIPGGWAGSKLVNVIPGQLVRGVLSVLMILAAIRLLF